METDTINDIKHILGDVIEHGFSKSFKDLSGRAYKQVRGEDKYSWVTFDEVPDPFKIDREEFVMGITHAPGVREMHHKHFKSIHDRFCEDYGFNQDDLFTDNDTPAGIAFYNGLLELLKNEEARITEEGEVIGIPTEPRIYPKAMVVYRGGPVVQIRRNVSQKIIDRKESPYDSKVSLYIVGARDSKKRVDDLVTSLTNAFPQLERDSKVNWDGYGLI